MRTGTDRCGDRERVLQGAADISGGKRKHTGSGIPVFSPQKYGFFLSEEDWGDHREKTEQGRGQE